MLPTIDAESEELACRRPRRDPALRQARAVAARRLPHDRCAGRRALCRQGEERQEPRSRLCAAGRPRHPHRAHDRGHRALEFVVTRTETEALLLEANLIKRLRPRFNVLLRDDKSFPYILITSDHWAPQILKHRGARTRPGHYYGPFASVWAVNRTINALQRAFLLRSCSDPFFESRTRPCLLHQIKRCSAPCTNEIDFSDYAVLVREANAFLSGRSKAVKDELAAEMEKAVAGARFRARRGLPRPPGGAVGHSGAPGRQPARRRGGRCVRPASAGRLHLRRGVLLPHRAELGQPRLFSQGRPLDLAGRNARRVPRPVLRRQAVAAPDPDLARHRGSRAARGSAQHQERAQDRGRGAAARRKEGSDRARARQRARGARPQARRDLLAGEAAPPTRRDLRLAARAAAHRGLRQQPHSGHERGRRHDRRRAGGFPQERVPQVQHPLGRSYARRRFRHDARGADAPLQAAAWPRRRYPLPCGRGWRIAARAG